MTYSITMMSRQDDLIEISQRLNVMIIQESSVYTVEDYLKPGYQRKLHELTMTGNASEIAADGMDNSSDNSTTNSTIDERWRRRVCKWYFDIVDYFEYDREVVPFAVNYLDRYVATCTVNLRKFHLAAMTAIYIAIKLFEPNGVNMASLLDWGRPFIAENIVNMENIMLHSLKWYVHPPIPFSFCRYFMMFVSGDVPPLIRHDINELARFLTELSVCEYWFVKKKSSSIALAALINAIELQGPSLVDPVYKIEFLQSVVELNMDIDISDEEIIDCYERLRLMYIDGGYTHDLQETRNGGATTEEVDNITISPISSLINNSPR